MARASAPKEQERVAEAAKRSVETCSAGRAGAHPYRRRRSGSGYHSYGALVCERLPTLVRVKLTNTKLLSVPRIGNWQSHAGPPGWRW